MVEEGDSSDTMEVEVEAISEGVMEAEGAEDFSQEEMVEVVEVEVDFSRGEMEEEEEEAAVLAKGGRSFSSTRTFLMFWITYGHFTLLCVLKLFNVVTFQEFEIDWVSCRRHVTPAIVVLYG